MSDCISSLTQKVNDARRRGYKTRYIKYNLTVNEKVMCFLLYGTRFVSNDQVLIFSLIVQVVQLLLHLD